MNIPLPICPAMGEKIKQELLEHYPSCPECQKNMKSFDAFIQETPMFTMILKKVFGVSSISQFIQERSK